MANTYERWATSVLTRLGVHPNRENLRALVGWAKAEGGHFHNQAKYNVLNTTQPEPGAGNTGSQGNIKVYRSWDQGVQATVETLRNGRYGGIIRALKHGSADDVAYAIGASPWGTSADLVRRTIGSTGAVRPSGAGLPGGGSSPAGGTPSYATTGAVDNSAERRQIQQSYLAERGQPRALLNLAVGLRGAQDVAGTRVPVGAPDAPQDTVQPGGRFGKVTINPGADRAGVHTNPAVIKFARRVAALYGHPLTVGTGTNHNRLTVDGNVSDHWSGNAVDIPLTGKALLRAGRAALIAAGMPRKQAMKQTGGLFNVNGHQVIFLTNQGGNHFNHLHVST